MCLNFFGQGDGSGLTSCTVDSGLRSVGVLKTSLVRGSLTGFGRLSFERSVVSRGLSAFAGGEVSARLSPALVMSGRA